MTEENRIVFEPSDIEAVRFECRECGGGVAVARRKAVEHKPSIELCPSCRKPWRGTTSPTSVYDRFLGALRDLAAANSEDFIVRLEISSPSDRA